MAFPHYFHWMLVLSAQCPVLWSTAAQWRWARGLCRAPGPFRAPLAPLAPLGPWPLWPLWPPWPLLPRGNGGWKPSSGRNVRRLVEWMGRRKIPWARLEKRPKFTSMPWKSMWKRRGGDNLVTSMLIRSTLFGGGFQVKFGSSCSHSPCDAFRSPTNGSCRFANSPETYPSMIKK